MNNSVCEKCADKIRETFEYEDKMLVKLESVKEYEPRGHTYMQWIFAIIANLTLLSYGMQIGWISPMIKYLQSNQSPVGNPLTAWTISLAASILCLVAVIGVPLYAYICDTSGRRVAIILVAVPQAVCWAIKLFFPNEKALIVARAMAGLAAGGCFNAVPMYIKEISENHNRGMLGSLVVPSQNIGVLIMYALGATLDYFTVLWIVMWFPILIIILALKAPESPSFLLKKGKHEVAAKTLALLRGLHVEHQNIQNEIQNIKNGQEMYKDVQTVTYFTMFKNKAWRQMFFLLSVMLFLCESNGVFGIVTFASSVLKAAGVTFNPELLTLSFPAVMIISGLLSINFVDRFGRKPVLIFVQIVSIISIGSVATIQLLQTKGIVISSWFSLVAIVIAVAAFGGGISPIPYIIVSEVFPYHIRAKAVSLIVMEAWLTSFMLLAVFGPVVDALGQYTLFYSFVVINLAALIITAIFLPETKGKSVEEIEESFLRK